jgi:cation diffusion facilitator CzcD-associated flavoprotein CzcO
MTSTQVRRRSGSARAVEEVDVLIIGAGISGIGAAVHLHQGLPGMNYAILERRQAIGGTWDLFRYPGIRSDSDMHTLGYRFRPWRDDDVLADGPAIRKYVEDTAEEYGVTGHVRLGHRVTAASWDSTERRWTVRYDADGTTGEIRCRFLWGCSGYYSYDEGHDPGFAGVDDFRGQVVHPQFWP